jgi:hypothetical protein
MEHLQHINNINEDQDPLKRGGSDPLIRTGIVDPLSRIDPLRRDPLLRDPLWRDPLIRTGTSGTAGTSGSSGGTNTKDMPADVKAFQDWLDKTHKGWCTGYKDGILNKGKDEPGFHSGGYGMFGPRTRAGWVKYREEFIKQGGKAVPYKGRSGGGSNGGNNSSNGGGRANQDYSDMNTKGSRLCKDDVFPIEYGCKNNNIERLKEALGLNVPNDGIYGDKLLDLLANSQLVMGLDNDKAAQYKKDHSYKIPKEVYDSILNINHKPNGSNTGGQTNIVTPQPEVVKYDVGDVLEGEADGKKYKITIKGMDKEGGYLVDVEDTEGNVTKTKIDENSKLTILGLLTEDDKQGGNLLDDKGYQAILDFENSLGKVEDDGTGKFKPVGMGYKTIKNKPQEQIIKDHISNTIGLDNWFKISPLFRTQIYSFMFNSDSDQSGDKYRWLGGLAQSIDGTFDRSTVVKAPSDKAKPNTENAKKIVKDAISSGKINSYYGSYLSALDLQYQSVRDNNKSDQMDANYDKLWSKRPKYLEQLYNGVTIGELLHGVEAKKEKEKEVTKPSNTNTTSDNKTVNKTDEKPTVTDVKKDNVLDPKKVSVTVGPNQTFKLSNGLLGPF